ncbi:hypothetical protein AB0K12_44515 [Nonomuraea sp. NPDC049419]|uniref:hypothetical protein n=1 Tax=Nonomuraea sp. NPDC049419 TaxID=3155772 RepID=UPI0034181470
MDRRRWDIDERFTGVCDATAMLPAVHRLGEAMASGGWVTEDPEVHLLPHLRGVPGWEVLDGRLVDDGFYEVRARREEELEGVAAYRAAIRLLSVIAEPSFLVRQAAPGVYECVTGVLDGDGVYRSHGHLVRLIVT